MLSPWYLVPPSSFSTPPGVASNLGMLPHTQHSSGPQRPSESMVMAVSPGSMLSPSLYSMDGPSFAYGQQFPFPYGVLPTMQYFHPYHSHFDRESKQQISPSNNLYISNNLSQTAGFPQAAQTAPLNSCHQAISPNNPSSTSGCNSPIYCETNMISPPNSNIKLSHIPIMGIDIQKQHRRREQCREKSRRYRTKQKQTLSELKSHAKDLHRKCLKHLNVIRNADMIAVANQIEEKYRKELGHSHRLTSPFTRVPYTSATFLKEINDEGLIITDQNERRREQSRRTSRFYREEKKRELQDTLNGVLLKEPV
eukprot:gene4281-6598_t